MSRWLVTGGAGYIGSHVTRDLIQCGEQVVVVDNLSTGFRERLPKQIPFYNLDCRDKKSLMDVARTHKIEGVVHLAAFKHARESMSSPFQYWDNNVGAMLGALALIEEGIVKKFIFSSSCSVYGSSPKTTEFSPVNPESPYAYTKLVCERMLQDLARKSDTTFSILRYFNVIGCSDFDLAQDTSPHCLVPSVFEKLKNGEPIEIYGKEMSTPDGTPIRDYLDVRDLANAHTLISKTINRGMEFINVSSGIPVSVMKLVSTAISVTGVSESTINLLDQKAGDPPEIWGVTSKILVDLGWVPKWELFDSLKSHWTKVADAHL